MKRLMIIFSMALTFLSWNLVSQAQEITYLDDIKTIQELQRFVETSCPDSKISPMLKRYEHESQESIDKFIRDTVSAGCFPCCFCCGDLGDCCSECKGNNSLTANNGRD